MNTKFHVEKPEDPEEGDAYFDSVTEISWVYTNNMWTQYCVPSPEMIPVLMVTAIRKELDSDVDARAQVKLNNIKQIIENYTELYPPIPIYQEEI